jgi:hypothetical protein
MTSAKLETKTALLRCSYRAVASLLSKQAKLQLRHEPTFLQYVQIHRDSQNYFFHEHSEPGLPEGFFFIPKSEFGYMYFGGLWKGNWWYFLYMNLSHDIILWSFCIFCGKLVQFIPVLACCTSKNLATLLWSAFFYQQEHSHFSLTEQSLARFSKEALVDNIQHTLFTRQSALVCYLCM